MILRDVLPKTNLKENSTNPSTIEDKTPPLVGLLIGVIITIAVLVLVLYCVWKKCVRRKRKRQRFNSRSPNAAIHKAIQQPRALKEMSRANESGKKHGVNAKILGSCGDLMAVREQASSSSIVASNDVQQEVLGSGKELTIASEAVGKCTTRIGAAATDGLHSLRDESKSSNSILPSALINEMCSSSHNKSICLALFAVIGVIALTNVADASANHALMEMRTILDDGFDAAHDQVKGDEKHKHPRLQSGVHRTLGKMIALGYALKSTYVPNEVANRTKVVVGGLIDEASVPEKIKDFFAAKGAKALSDENKSELDCVNHCLEKESISDEDQDEESAKSGGAGIHQDINDNLNLRSLSSGGSRVYQGRFDESFGTGSINCSTLMDTEKCLAECHKDSGVVGGQQSHDHETPFLDYIEYYINRFSGSICHGDPNKVIKFDEILKDCEFKLAPISMGKFLFSEGLTFVDNFLSAQELSKQCTLVRKTLIDSFASSLKALCQDSDQDGRELDSMVHLAAGLVLALNTEGRMIEQCPEVYHIRVGHQKPRTHSLQQQEDLESHSHSEPQI